ncbi:MAG: hypothetical protein ACOX6U_03150 [Oscillospiraceae bacterium]|jgi:hypothetical protein
MEGKIGHRILYWVFLLLSVALPFGLYGATEYWDYMRSRTFEFQYFWYAMLSLIGFGMVLGVFHCLHTRVGKWYGALLLFVVYAAYLIVMFSTVGMYLANAYTMPVVLVVCGLLLVETTHSILIAVRQKTR